MKKSRHDDFKTFGNAARAIYSACGWKNQWQLFLLHDKWNEIAGERTAEMTSPAFFRNKTLYIYVENSAWMQQVHFETRSLLQAVNAMLVEKQVDAIRLLLKPWEMVSADSNVSLPADRKIDTNSCQKMKHLVECIEDKGCREALYKLWHRSKARSRNT